MYLFWVSSCSCLSNDKIIDYTISFVNLATPFLPIFTCLGSILQQSVCWWSIESKCPRTWVSWWKQHVWFGWHRNLSDGETSISYDIHSGNLTARWLENGPGLNVHVFPISNGDIPASYVSLPEGIWSLKNEQLETEEWEVEIWELQKYNMFRWAQLFVFRSGIPQMILLINGCKKTSNNQNPSRFHGDLEVTSRYLEIWSHQITSCKTGWYYDD